MNVNLFGARLNLRSSIVAIQSEQEPQSNGTPLCAVVVN